MAIDRTQLFLEGQEVDIDNSKPIAVTYQSADVGNIRSIKADFSSQINLLDTERNHKVTKNSNQIGSQSKLVYSKIKADLIQSGIHLMKSGSTFFSEVNNGYKLNVIGGNFDFFKEIKDKTLRDLDMSAYDQAFNVLNVINSQSNTEGVVWPIISTRHPDSVTGSLDSIQEAVFNLSGTLVLPNEVRVSMLIPFMYKHTLVKEVIQQAGFNVQGDIFSNQEFLDSITSMQPPEDHAIWDETMTLNATDWMHDMAQADFLKSFMNQYGLFMETRDNNVKFYYIRDLYRNQGIAINWSDKFETMQSPSISFNVGYAINNRFEYSTDDSFNALSTANQPPKAIHWKTVVSDNKNLVEDLTVTIDFAASREFDLKPFLASSKIIAQYLPCCVITEYDTVLNAPEEGHFKQTKMYDMLFNRVQYFNPGLGGLPGTVYNFHFFFRKTNGVLDTNITNWICLPYFENQNHPGRVERLTTYNLAFPYLIGEYYNEVAESMIKDPVKVIAYFTLSPSDIDQLKNGTTNGVDNVVVPIYVKQLNGFYRVNKIDGFIAGRTTKVELIKL